jgi:hypothetical protein
MEGISKLLQVGQTVGLEDLAFGYRLTVMTVDQPGYQVAALGEDYVVLQDEDIKRRVPTFFIKEVITPGAEVAPQAA